MNDIRVQTMRWSSERTGEPAALALDGAVGRGRGDWTVRHLEPLARSLGRMRFPAASIRLEMSAIRRMDTGGAWLLARLVAQLRSESRQVEVVGLSPEAADLLELVRKTGLKPGGVPQAHRPGFLEVLGRRSLEHTVHAVNLLAFVGHMGFVWLRQVIRPDSVRWREIAYSLGEAGHKALGIVGLLAFLLGVVIAYQGGAQLRQYGGSLFVADLVGLSMVRELAPLITAIIVAGRTGSAYTAQIGTMQVTEEVDALRSLGIQPMELLVLPKLFALFIALPLLTVYADIMGILGGMAMASVQLDIAFSTFLDRLDVAITLDSFLVGVGKAPVFALIIATLGCYHGFQVSGSAESVGRRTTQSVVQSILAVIVVDAAFSVAFSYLGI
jgi:phospholipid/cholesterol/gamma-HCH transport system permease protein